MGNIHLQSLWKHRQKCCNFPQDTFHIATIMLLRIWCYIAQTENTVEFLWVVFYFGCSFEFNYAKSFYSLYQHCSISQHTIVMDHTSTPLRRIGNVFRLKCSQTLQVHCGVTPLWITYYTHVTLATYTHILIIHVVVHTLSTHSCNVTVYQTGVSLLILQWHLSTANIVGKANNVPIN